MESKYVSIIIPVYNGEKYIRRAVQSALNQTYPFTEIIVVNDGSTDNTANILSEFNQIKIISIENKGVSNARNIGLDNCTGDYIIFLDCDDELEPYAVETAVNKLEENSCDILVFRSITVENGKSNKSCLSNSISKYEVKDYLVSCLDDDPITYSIWDKIFTRKIIGETRFDVKRTVHEDSYFVFCVALKKPKVVNCEVCLHIRHITDNSLSRNRFNPKLLDIIELADCKYKIIKDEYPHLSDKAIKMKIKANMAMLAQFTKVGGGYSV